MPDEIGWRPADGNLGGFDVVTEQNPFPVQLIQTNPLEAGASIYGPKSFSYPLAGSVGVLVKAGQGYLQTVVVSSINAGIRYLQFFNKTTAPASTEVPFLSIPIGAGSATVPLMLMLGAGQWGSPGLYFPVGIAIGVSTAAASYTAATASDHALAGLYY